MKVSELQGAALDWAVAIAVGQAVDINSSVLHGYAFVERYEVEPWPGADNGNMPYSPSTNWQHGGPLIEQYVMMLCRAEAMAYTPVEPGLWLAVASDNRVMYDGPTPLIAACRAIVAVKLGDDIDIPEELKS